MHLEFNMQLGLASTTAAIAFGYGIGKFRHWRYTWPSEKWTFYSLTGVSVGFFLWSLFA